VRSSRTYGVVVILILFPCIYFGIGLKTCGVLFLFSDPVSGGLGLALAACGGRGDGEFVDVAVFISCDRL